MTYDELLPIYKKVRKVIRSCKTNSQLYTARKYAQLYMRLVPPIYVQMMAKQLTDLFTLQSKLLRFNYGTKKTKIN